MEDEQKHKMKTNPDGIDCIHTFVCWTFFFFFVVFDAAESACWYLMVIDSPIIGGLFTVASLSFDGDISVPFSLY